MKYLDVKVVMSWTQWGEWPRTLTYIHFTTIQAWRMTTFTETVINFSFLSKILQKSLKKRQKRQSDIQLILYIYIILKLYIILYFHEPSLEYLLTIARLPNGAWSYTSNRG